MKTLLFFSVNIFATSILLILPSLAHCNEKSHTKQPTYLELNSHKNLISQPVASVNGDSITVAELMARMQQKAKSTLKKIDTTLAKSIKDKSLNELIDEKVFLQHARSLNIKIDSETTNNHFANFKKRFKNDEQYKSYLKNNNLTESSLMAQIESFLTVKEMIKKEVDDTIEVTEEDIKKGYEVNINMFTQKEKVTINDVIFFLEPDTKDSEIQVSAILEKIKNDLNNDPMKLPPGETFVVKEEIEVIKNKNEKLFEVAKTLSVGELTKTVDSHDTMHIIQLVQYIPGSIKSLEEAWPVLEQKIEKKFKDTKLAELKSTLRNEAEIEVFDIYHSFEMRQ